MSIPAIDETLLKEHTGIMSGFTSLYTTPVVYDRKPSSTKIIELAKNDVNRLVAAAQNQQVKRGFGYAAEALDHLSGLSFDDVPGMLVNKNDSIEDHWDLKGINALHDLGISCMTKGPSITDGLYIGQNPCRNPQYAAVAATDEINARIDTRELPVGLRHLSAALKSYTEQCLSCPYRALEPKR